jgi:hypothetical protein
VDDDGVEAPDLNQDYSDVVGGYKKFRAEQEDILGSSSLSQTSEYPKGRGPVCKPINGDELDCYLEDQPGHVEWHITLRPDEYRA